MESQLYMKFYNWTYVNNCLFWFWQHVIVKHSSWFMMKYESLLVWSIQGMEKSHYEAKMTYTKHMQHFGTLKYHLPIVQTFQWWYKVIQEREHKREKVRALASSPTVIATWALAEKKRQAYLSSAGSERHSEWCKGWVQVQSRSGLTRVRTSTSASTERPDVFWKPTNVR